MSKHYAHETQVRSAMTYVPKRRTASRSSRLLLGAILAIVTAAIFMLPWLTEGK